MLQCHLDCNIKLFLCICIYIWQNEAFPFIKEGRSNHMDIPGQTQARTLIIKFHFHFEANKQWLADFKILYILSSLIAFHEIHFVGIDHNKPCYPLKRLFFYNVLQYPLEYFSPLMSFFYHQNILIFASSFTARPIYYLFSKIKIAVIFTASIASAPLTC